MRPYFVLCAVLLIAGTAFGQQPVPRIYGPSYWGGGPFVPLITTPMVSLQSVSPNPVGASNATTGLISGATNSTLSQIQGSTSSEYTEPVWYQGGDAPIMSSRIHLWREGRGHPMARHEEYAEREEEHGGWLYFTGSEHTASAATASNAAKGSKKAAHVYTNEDVERQNQNNGIVKYGGKTEKM